MERVLLGDRDGRWVGERLLLNVPLEDSEWDGPILDLESDNVRVCDRAVVPIDLWETLLVGEGEECVAVALLDFFLVIVGVRGDDRVNMWVTLSLGEVELVAIGNEALAGDTLKLYDETVIDIVTVSVFSGRAMEFVAV